MAHISLHSLRNINSRHSQKIKMWWRRCPCGLPSFSTLLRDEWWVGMPTLCGSHRVRKMAKQNQRVLWQSRWNCQKMWDNFLHIPAHSIKIFISLWFLVWNLLPRPLWPRPKSVIHSEKAAYQVKDNYLAWEEHGWPKSWNFFSESHRQLVSRRRKWKWCSALALPCIKRRNFWQADHKAQMQDIWEARTVQRSV